MEIVERFTKMIQDAEKILISTHLHPDADGIGSQIALCVALRRLGKEAYCVNEEPLLERYKYLDPENVVFGLKDFPHKDYDPDLFIVVDTNALPRIGTAIEKFVQRSNDILFIDHHPCPKEVAKIHCVDTSKAATGELVGELIQSMKVKFDRTIALALYTAVLIDTSSFRYPTVTGKTHRLIADLMDAGVSPPEAYNFIYGTKKITYMKLLGTILSSAQTTENEEIAWITMTEEALDKFDVDTEDTHGFINNLLILDNIKIACMFRQIGNSVKISFRSAGDIDVGIMAQALGGGGHNHSAATVLEGKIEDVVPRTIKKLQVMLESE